MLIAWMALHPRNKRLNVPYWWPLWVIFETTKPSGKTEDQQEYHFTQVMVQGIYPHQAVRKAITIPVRCHGYSTTWRKQLDRTYCIMQHTRMVSMVTYIRSMAGWASNALGSTLLRRVPSMRLWEERRNEEEGGGGGGGDERKRERERERERKK